MIWMMKSSSTWSIRSILTGNVSYRSYCACRKSIKVLIISRFDDHHAKSMIDFLDFYCTDNFEFTQMIKYNLTVDDIEASDADVVVANFMMPELKKKPFICTSSLSSLELVEKLNAFFYDFTSAEH